MNIQLEILKRARSILASPDRWTQFALARRADGRSCYPSEPGAVRFCAYGALVRAAAELKMGHGDKVAMAELAAMAWAPNPNQTEAAVRNLVWMNDAYGWSIVAAMFDAYLLARLAEPCPSGQNSARVVGTNRLHQQQGMP